MVLTSLATSILNRLIGNYVVGFGSSDVKFSLSGEIELKNLQLKPTAFESSGLPIRIAHGSIGKLFLKVPWSSLGTQHASVQIEDINIVIVPYTPTKDDVCFFSKLLYITQFFLTFSFLSTILLKWKELFNPANNIN